MKNATHARPALALLLLACMNLELPAIAQQETVPARLSSEQVVHNLVRMNGERAQALRSYQGKRIYRLEYHGFPGTRKRGDGRGCGIPVTRNERVHNPA